jgi:transposase
MQREAYPSDLTDSPWAAVEPLIPPPAAGGRKREADMREIVDAIRHLRAMKCGWRGLPAGFPNRSTVRYYYDAWREAGVWDKIDASLATTTAGPEAPDCPVAEEAAEPGNGAS